MAIRKVVFHAPRAQIKITDFILWDIINFRMNAI